MQIDINIIYGVFMQQKYQKINEQRGRLIWEEKHNAKKRIMFLPVPNKESKTVI